LWHMLDEFSDLRLLEARDAERKEWPQRAAPIFPIRHREIHDRLDLALLSKLVGIVEHPFPLVSPQRADDQRSKHYLECDLLIHWQRLHTAQPVVNLLKQIPHMSNRHRVSIIVQPLPDTT